MAVAGYVVIIPGKDSDTAKKFLDRRKTNYCESICQECFH